MDYYFFSFSFLLFLLFYFVLLPETAMLLLELSIRGYVVETGFPSRGGRSGKENREMSDRSESSGQVAIDLVSSGLAHLECRGIFQPQRCTGLRVETRRIYGGVVWGIDSMGQRVHP